MSQLFIAIGLIILGLFIGSYLENRHYASIKKREDQSQGQVCLSTKTIPKNYNVVKTELATGSVVIAIDHFKRLLYGLRALLGGEVKSYSSLIDRARREAVLRMKESHPDASAIVNLRIETFSISKGEQGQITSVEVFAYGTALWVDA